uniref:p53 and DNA damage-regulated protein 1 n=2 Tax=Petromyzon marinus TaxID=7757 RepID=A0AAJ7T9A9_PETMA|nr:p53 and DNA damage-regulated protein 1 [Petromyzon marinus]
MITFATMTADAQFLITYLTEVEALAEDLLADKHQMVALDRKRNSNREALRAVQGGAAAEKTWVCFGNMFIKIPRSKTRQMIKNDQEQLESEMTRIRRELKVKLNRLNEAQGKPELKGFDLAPLSREEMLAINKVIKE